MRQHSRWLRPLALVLGVTLVAAACGDDDDSETSGDETTTTAEEGGAAAGPEVGEAAPTCQGESDGVLRIGGLLPQTGDLAFLGPPEEAGAALGIEDVNAAGGVLGKPAEFLAGDSGDGDPDIANPTVDGHLAAGVDAILGAAASGVSLNVIDKITKENCKIHFSPANTSPEFTDYDDGDLYFRTAPSDVLQGRILSDLIVEDGNTTVALLARQDSYGEGLLAVHQGAPRGAGCRGRGRAGVRPRGADLLRRGRRGHLRRPRRAGHDRLRRVEHHPQRPVRAGFHARREEHLPGRRQHR